MADALGTAGGVVSAVDHRLNQAGLIAAQTSSLAVRTGVMVGPGSTALVTGTAATGTMTVSIAAHHWVTTRGTADGVYLGTKEAAGTVNIAAAPGANSRIDVVYVKQNDAGSSISPDGSTAEFYGVVTGTAAASPTKPALPVGAVELATVTVAAGATSTNGAGVTISNTAVQVSARGARIGVRTQAERDALTQYAGLEVYRIDTGQVQLSNGSAWATTYDPALSVPLPVCSVRQTTTQGVNVNSWAVIGFDVADTDPDGLFAVGSPTRITIKRKGIYRVGGVAAFVGASSAYRFGSQITKNGTALPSSANGSALSGQPGGAYASVTVQLNVNDYVGLNGVHTFGPSLGTQIAVDTASLLSVECIRLLP